MRIYANATLCYGYLVKSEPEFPWDDYGDEYYDDWYYENLKPFSPTKEIYGEDGLKLEEITDDEKKAYWDEWKQHRKNNPVPFNLVTYGHEYSEKYIIAVPNSIIEVDQYENAKSFSQCNVDVAELAVFQNFVFQNLIDQIDLESLNWYLSANLSMY